MQPLSPFRKLWSITVLKIAGHMTLCPNQLWRLHRKARVSWRILFPFPPKNIRLLIWHFYVADSSRYLVIAIHTTAFLLTLFLFIVLKRSPHGGNSAAVIHWRTKQLSLMEVLLVTHAERVWDAICRIVQPSCANTAGHFFHTLSQCNHKRTHRATIFVSDHNRVGR